MRTILDDSKTWFLQNLSYEKELLIALIEGFIGSDPENILIGNTIVDSYPIDISQTSKLVLVRFPQYIAWQVVDESFTCLDEYEQRDDTSFLQVLERSKYLDYVNSCHGWYADIIGIGKHYRVWTENEVIDVVACDAPTIEQMSK